MQLSTATNPTVSLRGRSGQSHQFRVYPWGTEFKPVGGVYAVLRLDGLLGYTALYVGQTTNLSERFDGHHKRHCFDRHRKTHIGVLVEPSTARQLAIESDLVAANHLVCNG